MLAFDFLPEQYQRSAFIAGGYAACPSLASDIDVWVPLGFIGRSEEDHKREAMAMETARRDILAHLESEFFPYKVEDNYVTSEGSTDDGYPIAVQKVARIESVHLVKPIHIMVSAGTVDDVLGFFDISTHQVALTRGGVLCGPGWTPITEMPQILPGSRSVKTQQRLLKIASRYGHIKGVQG